MRNGITAVSLAAVLCMSSMARADSLTVQYLGATVNDGSYYVMPYELSVNGVDMEAICYDFSHEISLDETWQASELTLGVAQSGGIFSGVTNASTDYEEVGWLASIFFTQTLTAGDQVDLQHAIWDVFDPGQFTLPNDEFLNNLFANEPNLAQFDSSDYLFLEAVPNGSTTAQSFVIYEPDGIGGGGGQEQGIAPESESVVLAAIGFVLIGLSRGAQLRKGYARRRAVIR